MPRDMFGDIVEPSIKVGSQKWYTVPLSIIVHTAIIGAVVIIPLMAADVLPSPPGYDERVRGGRAAAAAATPTASAAGSGRGAQAGDGRQPGGRAGGSAQRDQG